MSNEDKSELGASINDADKPKQSLKIRIEGREGTDADLYAMGQLLALGFNIEKQREGLAKGQSLKQALASIAKLNSK